MAGGISPSDFRNYKSTAAPLANRFNWKKTKANNTATIALVAQAAVYPLWRHSIPRVMTLRKDGEPDRNEVWSRKVNSAEHDEISKRQYYRRDDGVRKYPPLKCPVSKLIDDVAIRCAAGHLKPSQPLFRWQGDDPDRAEVIRAYGLLNRTKKEKLSNAELADLQKAGVRLSSMWKQSFMARCEYVFRIVDLDDLDAGTMISIESKLLGDVMIDEMNKLAEQFGPDMADPSKTPLAWKWSYHEAAQIDKKYRAIPLPNYEISEAAKELIMSTPPSVDHIVGEHDWGKLRADLEDHALVPFDWDRIFGAVEREAAEKIAGSLPKDDRPLDVQAAEAFAPVNASTSSVADAEAEAVLTPQATTQLYDCDVCGAKKVMTNTDLECPACGTKYAADGSIALPAAGYEADGHGGWKKLEPVATTANSEPQAQVTIPVVDEEKDPFDDGDDIPWAN